MISNQILQNTIDGITAISRAELCVTDTDGKVVVATYAEARDFSAAVREFVKSPADGQEMQGCHFFKISAEQQLEYIGVSRYLSFCTFSCYVGVFKPDPKIYLDALEKCGVSAEETVFIDDSVRNLQGAAELGILPILIAANPGADVETDYLKIHDLRELIR